MNVIGFFALYAGIVNLAGFLLMGIDKRRARKGAFRIPEANLFLAALVGGSAGCLLGMYVFRHKTKHLSFVMGMPVILLLQLGLVVYLLTAAPIRFTLM